MARVFQSDDRRPILPVDTARYDSSSRLWLLFELSVSIIVLYLSSAKAGGHIGLTERRHCM